MIGSTRTLCSALAAGICIGMLLIGGAIQGEGDPAGRVEAPASLPMVLLIGDSIMGSYYPIVANRLAGRACIVRIPVSRKRRADAILAERERNQLP